MRTGLVVVVTGAAGGIGSCLVERFLANGDTVVAADLKDEGLAPLRDRAAAGARVVAAAGDITKEADCDRVAALARDTAGRVDVLINCAGWYPTRAFEELTADEWRRVVDVNLTGTFLMTRAVVPLMKGRGWGRIVNFSSASIYVGVADQAHYVAAKSGLIGLTRSSARALGAYGIGVNAVTPGLTLTPPMRAFPEPMLDQARTERAFPRDEHAPDLVGAVFFLASPDADFMTGQAVNVDGGSHMQ